MLSGPKRDWCSHCDGFGFVSVGIGSGWYQRDWRLMLDPNQEWELHVLLEATISLSNLHECLARELRHRLHGEIQAWINVGGWQCGSAPASHEAAGQVVFIWRDIICLPPGPMTQFDHWLIVSRLGALRLPDLNQVAYHLSRAGAPELPRRELWP